MRQITQQKTRVNFSEISQKQLLGKGSVGQVYKVKQGNKTYAMKQINKLTIHRVMRQKQLRRQVQIMKMINHENIVKFYDFIDDKNSKFYQLKLQFCEGTNLKNFLLDPQKYQKLVVQPKITKYFAIKICLDYINAIVQLRNKLISNRDIKPENFIIQQLQNSKFKAKMVDLGQARFIVQNALSFVGSREYMAPQIRFGGGKSYSEACDLWSLGETMYQSFEGLRKNKQNKPFICLAFKQNFQFNSQNDLLIYFSSHIFQGISFDKEKTPAPFRQVIRGLLRVIAQERIQLIQVLEILYKRFQQYQSYFDQKQRNYQKNRLGECIIKQKQTKKRKSKIKQCLSKIKYLYFQIIKKITQNLNQNQYQKYPDALKLIILCLQKLHYLIDQILNNIGYQEQISRKSKIQTQQFIIQQILFDVLSKQQYDSIMVEQHTLYKYLQQNQIQVDIEFKGISQNLNNFILTKFGVLCLPVMEAIVKIFSQ